MSDFDKQLQKYADLAVRLGINVQPGQTLVIRSTTSAVEFVRKVVRSAYSAGAKYVYVDWEDDEVNRIRLKQASAESLHEVQEWKVRGYEHLAEEGAGFLSILAPNPESMKGIDPKRVAAVMKANRTAMKTYNEYIQSDKVSWSVIAVPTPEWALTVFPELPVEDGVKMLWDLIFRATRVREEDPLTAWKRHVEDIKKRTKWLTERQFRCLRYTGPGTDLTVELPTNHVWIGGGSQTPNGVFFVPNIPTEEVFTVPLKTGVNGVVKSTKPLYYAGQLIRDFSLRFDHGRIVEVKAEDGQEALETLIETDEGSHYLGEVALVPHNSPISQTDIVFKNTLFDENASNHLAIGSAYPFCLQGGTTMSKEELEARGINTSVIHVDFMMGSAEMNIDAMTTSGDWVPLFRNGNWVSE
jgi:aminopeptidase